MTYTVTLNSSKKSTFIEGNGYAVNFLDLESFTSKRSGRVVTRSNTQQIKIIIKFSSSKNSIKYITKSKHEDLFGSLSKDIRPYTEKGESLIECNSKVHDNFLISKSNGDNKVAILQEFTPYRDREDITTKRVLEEKSAYNFLSYPFSTNYYRLNNRGSTIDAFHNLKKIKHEESAIDRILGFRSNCLNSGKNAIGENIVIKDFVVKNQKSVAHYDDSVVEDILFNTRDKIVKKITGYTYSQSDSKTFQVSSFKKTKHSVEPRFFSESINNKVLPFRDITHKENFYWLDDRENLFKSSNTEIGEKILQSRNKSDLFKEDIRFYSNGYSLDRSITLQKESIAFRGVAN